MYLSEPLLAVHGLSGTLYDIGTSVELRGLAPLPQITQSDGISVGPCHRHARGDDGERTAKAGKARRFGKRTAFHGHFFRAGNLENAVRDIRSLMDERFIGRIIDDERVVTAGIVHPPRESVAAENSPCRIVRVAEVDDVGDDRRKIGNEGVLFRTGKIDEVAPALPVPCSGAARHGIGVDIDRVHGVCDRHS